MESVKSQILGDVQTITKGITHEKVVVEVGAVTDPRWGDFTTNIALRLSAVLGKPAPEIAKLLQAKLVPLGRDYEVSASPNGFINFTLKTPFLQNYLRLILDQNRSFGKNDAGNHKKMQIEFISANPTGPLTLGNGRGGFGGDTLANVLEWNGYDIEREYYVNDIGNQIKVLGYSVAKELGLVGEEGDEFYAGDYIKGLAASLKEVISLLTPTGDDPFYQKVGSLAQVQLLADIKRVVKEKLNINFDTYFLESSLYTDKRDQKVLKYLKDKGFSFEKDGAVWLQTTKWGDDKDRVLVKETGEPTYFLSDIAHKTLFAPDYYRLILFLGADHYGYQERLQAGLKAFSFADKLDIVIFQLVRLIKDGQEVRMSKRAGTYVAIEDLIDEVGVDVARFFFLMHAYNTHLDFDLNLAKKKTNDNPVYYVQYAHARLQSILNKAPDLKGEADFGLLTHQKELALIKKMVVFPDLIVSVAESYEVQRLPYYALELAESLHQFYQECTVISDDRPLTLARLELVKAVKIVLHNCLEVMGISAPEKM